MAYDPKAHHRRSIRLRGWDYARPGLYFVTVCTQGKEHVFGAVADGEMRLNEYGRNVAACWEELPRHYPRIRVDGFIVMPNHVHGIIEILDVGAGLKPARPPRLNDFVRAGLRPAPTAHNGIVGAGLKPARPPRLNDFVRAGLRPAPAVRNGIAGAGLKPAPTRGHSVSEIVRAFKTFSARGVNRLRRTAGKPLWQRNYYEHIIRNERELAGIQEYIATNPVRWDTDPENPGATMASP